MEDYIIKEKNGCGAVLECVYINGLLKDFGHTLKDVKKTYPNLEVRKGYKK